MKSARCAPNPPRRRGGSAPGVRERSAHCRSLAFLVFLLHLFYNVCYSISVFAYLYTQFRVYFFSCYDVFPQALLIILMHCSVGLTAYNHMLLKQNFCIKNKQTNSISLQTTTSGKKIYMTLQKNILFQYESSSLLFSSPFILKEHHLIIEYNFAFCIILCIARMVSSSFIFKPPVQSKPISILRLHKGEEKIPARLC